MTTGASPLNFGLIMLTLADSEVFRRSLLSLLNSGFPGKVVVVEEGIWPGRTCESFCQEVSVEYIKSPRWDGPANNLKLGIQRLAPETDVVIHAHNDILWTPSWFRQLDDAWQKVYHLDKVALINLGYMEYSAKVDPVLLELFVRGSYDDLLWLLKTMKNIKPLMKEVQDVQNQGLHLLFGLGRDSWNDDASYARFMTGRFSVAASFPLQIWRNLGGFDPDLQLGSDLELQYYCLQNHQWNLWISNTPPLIHMRSFDTRSLLSESEQIKFNKMEEDIYKAIPQKYGLEIDHFLNTYFAETTVIYHDEIVEAVNALRFGDIEFVFDDFFERLGKKTLASCELVWCRSRYKCRYR